VVENGVLLRAYFQKNGDDSKQIVVPTDFRKGVMELAHQSIVGGHLSSKKTEDRILTSFYWPEITGDVGRFCRSCDVCQKTIPKGRMKKVSLGDMPVIEEPFHRVAIDLIGPIIPVSEKGNRYIFTVVDFATRYPEAEPLSKIDTESIAEALLVIFPRVGFPSEVLSDRGSQFTADLMKEICRLISVKLLFITPYNPKCNGLCERMNGVLKSMLRKMCQERPKDRDIYLPAVLFAYREVPQASTGFSPVKGPMQILRDVWTQREDPEIQNTYLYMLNLKQRLEGTCKIARESLMKAKNTYKHQDDKRARNRVLRVGDKVLLLLPTDNNKMMLRWKGFFQVVEVFNKFDYRIKIGDKLTTFHINLLKKYEERQEKIAASVAIIEDVENNSDGAVDDESLLDFPNYTSGET
jgi:hypothetical protein